MWYHPGFPILAELDAEGVGRIVGTLICFVGLGAGALKCYWISRRPATNSKCALSLMFLLALWAIMGLFGGVVHLIEPGSIGLALLGLMIGFLVVGALATAMVLAVLGLLEVKQRPGEYTQGRAQALWSLSMGVLLIVGTFVGTAVRLNSRTPGSLASKTPAGDWLKFEDMNFRFRAPDRPWASFDSRKFNSASQAGFLRRWPEMYFFILAEQLGSDSPLTTSTLVEFGKAHFRSVASSVRETRERPRRVNGLDGVVLELEAVVNGHRLNYYNWYCVTNGFAYQLLGYGGSTSRQQLPAEIGRLLERFELLDPGRLATGSGSQFTTNFVSPLYSYRVAVDQPGWRSFPKLDQKFPAAEFGAIRGATALCVVPVRAPEPVDPEALSAALLATMEINSQDERLTRRREITMGTLRGAQFDFERSVENKPFLYRMKLLQGGGLAYLIATWTLQGPKAGEILDEAARRVEFLPPLTPPPSRERYSAADLKRQAFFSNQIGLFHFKAHDYEPALGSFRAAAAANDKEPTYLKNALRAYTELGRPTEALDFLRPYLSGSRTNLLELRAYDAFFLAQSGQTSAAVDQYAALFTGSYFDEDFFTHYVRLLLQSGQLDQALQAVQKCRQNHDSLSVHLLEAQVRRQRKEFAAAISLLTEQRRQLPANAQLAAALVETHLDAGNCTEALALCQEMLKNGNDSANTYVLKGRSECGLKWYREAKGSLETALSRAPGNAEIKSFLDSVSGILGEGSNTALKEPIPPVPIPARLTNAPASSAQPTDYAREYGAFYLWRILAVSAPASQELRSTDYMNVRVLDSSGVAGFSTVQVPFDPATEALFVNELRVTDASGRVLGVGRLPDYYVLDAPAGGSISQKKLANIPVPGLQPGSQILLVVTRRQFGQAKDFLEHPFSQSYPSRRSVFFLEGQGTGWTWRTAPALPIQTSSEGLTWLVEEPPVARVEPLQPAAAEYLPTLWLAKAQSEWSLVASNYLSLIQSQLPVAPSVRELATNLVLKVSDEVGQIDAIARHVQSNYTYKAIEFGQRALIPNSADDILRNKYGDCKDHALLLKQMLEAVGIPARLALVHSSSPVQRDLPSLGQFDHMLVYLPRARRFLDVTQKGADLSQPYVIGLAGKSAFILDPERPSFIEMPNYPEGCSRVSVQRRIHLENQTDAAIQETVTFDGVHGAAWREFFLKMPPTLRRTVFLRQVDVPEPAVTAWDMTALEDTTAPLTVHLTYTLKRQFRSVDGRLAGPVHGGLERTLLAGELIDKRLTPFEFTVPLRVHSRIEFSAPSGFSPGTQPAQAIDLHNRFIRWEGSSQAQSDTIRLDFDAQQQTGKFLASDYSAYRDAVEHALATLEREIIFSPQNPATPSPQTKAAK
jgi:hypothetical protein